MFFSSSTGFLKDFAIFSKTLTVQRGWRELIYLGNIEDLNYFNYLISGKFSEHITNKFGTCFPAIQHNLMQAIYKKLHILV